MCGFIKRTALSSWSTIKGMSFFSSTNAAGDSIKTVLIASFSHFFTMTTTLRIINLMREMKVNQRIALEDVFQLYQDESKLYQGRPEMLVMKMKVNQQNLQLFRGGKVQILGRIRNQEAESMRHEIIMRLRSVPSMKTCQVSPLTISNIVASLQLPSAINLQNISHSNHNVSYEVELFPAALIRKWHPAHVAVFHNGKMIVTGVKSVSVLKEIFHCTQNFVSEKCLVKK